jgi:hypothetical protein
MSGMKPDLRRHTPALRRLGEVVFQFESFRGRFFGGKRLKLWPWEEDGNQAEELSARKCAPRQSVVGMEPVGLAG